MKQSLGVMNAESIPRNVNGAVIAACALPIVFPGMAVSMAMDSRMEYFVALILAAVVFYIFFVILS